ncbi:hypothetical protein FQA39_LY11048 [Lamprigera yunnana]|nr:hypothetical protein FQA39_LY11048 [Lamprigera yunnana]
MSTSALKIGFIGGGRMAKALAQGFISGGLSKGENMIASFHPADAHLAENFQKLGVKTVFENIPVLVEADMVVVAVKPSVVPVVLSDIKGVLSEHKDKLFLSLAMGVTIKQLEKYLTSETRLIRVMPNTPALVKSGVSVFVRGANATDRDVTLTKKLLSSVGTCDEVSEHLLDVVTALSGSGPAYVYVFIESLADGAVKMGLPRDLAYRLASQTVLGAGKMVRDTKIHPGILKDDVMSPAGSTAAALHYLEQRGKSGYESSSVTPVGFRSAIIGAVEEATKRCLQVSQSQKK